MSNLKRLIEAAKGVTFNKESSMKPKSQCTPQERLIQLKEYEKNAILMDDKEELASIRKELREIKAKQ